MAQWQSGVFLPVSLYVCQIEMEKERGGHPETLQAAKALI